MPPLADAGLNASCTIESYDPIQPEMCDVSCLKGTCDVMAQTLPDTTREQEKAPTLEGISQLMDSTDKRSPENVHTYFIYTLGKMED